MTTTDPITGPSSMGATVHPPALPVSPGAPPDSDAGSIHSEETSTPSTRDRALDLVRCASLVVVVLLHGMMAGISIGSGHRVIVTNALEGQPWFVPLSWLVQIMPLFFIVGGFAGITQWRRVQARGGSAVDFVRSRLERLARPAVVVFATIAAGLAAAALAGVSPDLLAQLGFRMAQPLWFLAVYLGVSSLVPVFAAAHARAPRRSIIALVSAALLIDVLRTTSGVEGLGYLNLGFVWLAVQQLGFWWADGAFRSGAALSRRRVGRGVGRRMGHRIVRTRSGSLAPRSGSFASLIGIAASLTALLALCCSGLSSPDLYDALNPPTSALILLGLAQVFALGALHPRLTIIAEDPQVRRMLEAVGSRSMTIYLWHMPVLVLIAAVLLLSGVVWPEPLSGPWWLTRGVWLGTILVVLIPVAASVGRFERGPSKPATRPLTRPATGPVTRPVPAPSGNPTSARTPRPTIRTAAAVGLAIIGVLGVLLSGYTVLTAITGALLLGAALRLVRSARSIAVGSAREISSSDGPAVSVPVSPGRVTTTARLIRGRDDEA